MLVTNNELATVLVVEDDPAIRAVCADAIRDLGYDVTEASDGAKAIDEIDRQRPSAIVLDLQLPRANGYEVLQHVRSTDSRNATPVIVMSAAATGRWSIRHGANAYLPKPFDLSRLTRVVHDSLTGVGLAH